MSNIIGYRIFLGNIQKILEAQLPLNTDCPIEVPTNIDWLHYTEFDCISRFIDVGENCKVDKLDKKKNIVRKTNGEPIKIYDLSKN